MARALPSSLLHLHRLDLPGEEQGAFLHRVARPLRLLAEEPALAPSERSWLAPDAPDLALAADILVVHALAGPEIEALIRWRRAAGRITLYEIGDELSAPRPWRRRAPRPPDPFVVGRQLLHASLADGVQFSSAGLSDFYAEISPHRAVLGNFVDFPPEPPAKPPGFVFGWAGTRSHRADLARIMPTVVAFCRLHTDAVFALMGDAELHTLCSDIPAAQFIAYPFGSYSAYREFLVTLHVGLVPLADTAFNRGRTNVKLVELAAAGAAVLAEDAPAYRHCGEAVLYFSDAASLVAQLGRLHANREVRAAAARAGWTALSAQHDAVATRAAHAAWYLGWPVMTSGPLPQAASTDQAARLDQALEWLRTGDHVSALEAGRALLGSEPNYRQARWLVVRLLAAQGAKDEALELGAPLVDCPIFSSLWKALAADLSGDVSLLSQVTVPELCHAQLGTTPAERAAYHCALFAAHPFHPFALAAERHRLERIGDAAGAAHLTRRLNLVTSQLGDAR